jgi:hypothetical protein
MNYSLTLCLIYLWIQTADKKSNAAIYPYLLNCLKTIYTFAWLLDIHKFTLSRQFLTLPMFELHIHMTNRNCHDNYLDSGEFLEECILFRLL